MTTLLLVGAGHAHLYVVRHAAELVAAGYRVTLLAPRHFHYSGLASATAAGTVPERDGRIDVAALAQRSGVAFHEGTLASLDRERRLATTADGSEIAYDVLSLNIGSVVAPPGMRVDDAVLRVKPLSSLNGLDALLAAAGAARPGTGLRVTVVGGGATGLELAAHLGVRRDVARVQLLEAAPRVGVGLPDGARRRLEKLLAARGVVVRTGCPITHLRAYASQCADGNELTHDAAILATGLAAPPLVAELGLGDDHGVPVRATLQHVDDDEIYAAGDCAHFLPRPLPRIGVHGVRQGPVLHASLLARANGRPTADVPAATAGAGDPRPRRRHRPRRLGCALVARSRRAPAQAADRPTLAAPLPGDLTVGASPPGLGGPR